MFDMRATADFARNGVFFVADSVDFEFFWIFVPELAVSLQDVASIGFVIFSKDDRKVSFNPFVNLVFDGFNFLGSEFVVAVEVKTHTIGGDVATFLANVA